MISFFLNNLLPAIITSSVVVGIATWLLKKYFSRRIDYVFNEREKILESKLRQIEKHKELIFNISAEFLPEIQEVVYRSRNLLKETINSNDLSHLDNIIVQWTKLSDHLYKYQLFLPEQTFELLHRYKRTYQNIVMMLSSASKEISEAGSPETRLAENDLGVLKEHSQEIEILYSDILFQLRQLIQSGE